MKKTLPLLFTILLMLTGIMWTEAQALNSSPTLTFSNMTGFGDNIAQDGEGNSAVISDINIQMMPINNSGTKLVADPLEYHDGSDWGTPSIITYGGTNSFFGWSIKSDNGADFSLVSFNFNDWGEWSGVPFSVQAFSNGSSKGIVSFSGNTNNVMVPVTNSGVLTSIFQNVDEVRIYKQNGTDSWTGLNNIKVSSPATTLPLTWLGFTANRQGTGVVLNWSTSREQNTKDYVVQHSGNGSNWHAIATVTAAGNSSIDQQYGYQHNNILSGIHYYRLLQRDVDGKESYSKVLAVNVSGAQNFLNVYPNPVMNGQLTVELGKEERIQLFNASGRLVFEKQLSAGAHLLQLSYLARGLYVIKTEEETKTLIMQ